MAAILISVPIKTMALPIRQSIKDFCIGFANFVAASNSIVPQQKALKVFETILKQATENPHYWRGLLGQDRLTRDVFTDYLVRVWPSDDVDEPESTNEETPDEALDEPKPKKMKLDKDHGTAKAKKSLKKEPVKKKVRISRTAVLTTAEGKSSMNKDGKEAKKNSSKDDNLKQVMKQRTAQEKAIGERKKFFCKDCIFTDDDRLKVLGHMKKCEKRLRRKKLEELTAKMASLKMSKGKKEEKNKRKEKREEKKKLGTKW